MTIISSILLLQFLNICLSNIIDNQFPKILWVYWQQGFQNAPIFTQLSIKNKEKISKESGWEMRFLTKKNLSQYLSTQQIDGYMAEAEDKLVQLKADIIRMLLLFKYGGMWMDANSIFLRNLTWVDQITSDQYIYNKLSDFPDVLIGAYTSYSHGGNITYYRNQTTNQLINVFPGFEDWFILSKPNSLFLGEALKQLKVILKTKKKVMDEKILRQGIILSPQHLDPYLIGSDYLFQVLIQTKQKQLDKQGKFAVQYYNIWHFQADQTVYKYTIYSRFKRYQMWADFLAYSLSDLKPVIGQVPYFWKFVGWQHPEFSLFLSNYLSFNCWNGDLLIQNQSQVSFYLLVDENNQIKSIIKSVQQQKDDKQICKNYLNNNYFNSNKQNIIFFLIQILLILFVIGVMFFVKILEYICEYSIHFKQLASSYR